ncbi:hypothetical protein RUM43_010184 [Polyplax serrata]|uniref:Reticulon-like protein n=1 Tax=Polyplax serrata TaxID=468196 RepID=A0AAN8S093_POLSC
MQLPDRGPVESLVYWRDPKKSGVVFGSVMVILLSLTTFSLISVVAYTSLAILGGALGFRIYKNVLQAVQKTAEGHPFKEFLEFDLTLSPERAREICDVVVSHLNSAVAKCRSLFLVEDIVDSVKFGFCLWCLTYVGSWFNGLSLLIISFVGLFTLPKVYENNKAVIDANLDVVRSKINEVTDKIRAVSPIGKKADDAKDKSE